MLARRLKPRVRPNAWAATPRPGNARAAFGPGSPWTALGPGYALAVPLPQRCLEKELRMPAEIAVDIGSLA